MFTLNSLQHVENKPTTPATAATASRQLLTNQTESGHSAILYLQRQNDILNSNVGSGKGVHAIQELGVVDYPPMAFEYSNKTDINSFIYLDLQV